MFSGLRISMITRRIFLGTTCDAVSERAASSVAKEHSLFHWRVSVLAFLFMAAFGVRMLYVNDPPLNFHATRQYRSLIIARGYYFDSSTSIPERERQVAISSRQKQGILEPPIMELLVSIGYRFLGGEHFWLPRLLSSVFWLIGGAFLYLIGKRIADEHSALFGTAFYLFLPFAVVASRSFQPDPLMVMLLLAAVFAILRYHDGPSNARLMGAAIVSSLAFLVKPHSVFAILAAFTAIAIYRQGIRRAIISQTLLVFVTIILLPTITIYIYNVVTGRFFPHEAWKTLLPQVWMSSFFWRSWINNIGLTVGFIPFIGALLGLLFFRDGLSRSLVMGLWTGYVIFGLALNYNFAAHDYYQLQLIPIVGLSLGPIIALVMNHLNHTRPQFHWRVAAWSALSLALVFSVAVARSRLVNADGDHKVRIQREIGELVNHSTKTIFLSGDYGVPLEYHGLLSGSPWPLASDLEWEHLAGLKSQTARERFNTWFAKASPEYFIVDNLTEFEQQKDLKQFLVKNFAALAQSEQYIIFDLRRKLISDDKDDQ
jgi:4-amino-4-deoxy-L-arabinose transferase-like glycosyltransferase